MLNSLSEIIDLRNQEKDEQEVNEVEGKEDTSEEDSVVKINKDMLAEKLKNSESVHKLSTEDILNKLFKINENLRKMPRSLRVKPCCATSIHNSAENIDFFLGLDKIMKWIEEI